MRPTTYDGWRVWPYRKSPPVEKITWKYHVLGNGKGLFKDRLSKGSNTKGGYAGGL